MSLHSDVYAEMISLLKKKRKSLRWTQTKLAELSGTHQSYISRVESCEQHIDIVDYFKLAGILGIDDAQILKTLHHHLRLAPAMIKAPFKPEKP